MATLPLYEQLAHEITHQVENGAFRPGERIPSVRQISRQRNLSVTTVLQAYRLLEDQGVIEARPQSGYYVRTRLSTAALEPEMSTALSSPCTVTIADLSLEMLRDAANPTLLQLGAAVPSPDLLPTERLNRLLASIAREADLPHHISGLPEGLEALRVQVAQRQFSSGCNLAPEDIIITAGCMEALNLALRATCKPGDLVAIESPTYFGILQALEINGLHALEIPTHHRTGVSLEALRFAIDNHPVRAVVLIPNFNNPLGSLMPIENKEALAAMLAQAEIPLIEDDICGELFFSGERPHTVKSFDRSGMVLLCSSFSKDVSPSFRLGWIAPGRFRPQVERLKLATNLGTPMLQQMAAARFLTSGGYEAHLRRIRRAYAERVAAMTQAVLECFPTGTRVTNPVGGCVLWVQLPEEVDSLDLYRRALAAGITIAPGYMFSAGSKYRNFVRLNAAYWSWKGRRAIEKLGELASLGNH